MRRRGLDSAQPGIGEPGLLRFVGEGTPESLTQLANTVLGLIDVELAANNSGLSAESRELLNDLKEDIADVKFDSMMRMERPRFVLTPQEIEWLERHEQNVWMDYLVHRYKFKLYPALRKLSDFPPHLFIEPSSICNLRCVMCFQVDESFSSNREFMGMMPWELFTSLVDQARDAGCHAVTLASRGEPTLHKRFGEMLRYLHEKRILDTKINTNATRLTETIAHDILASDISTVVFSVDAATKETYERIRVRGKFDRVLENIDRFNKIRESHYPKSGTTTRILGIAVDETQDPQEMKQFWSNYVDHVVIAPEIPRWDSYGNLPCGRHSVCNILYDRLYVWFNGVCNPCDFDYKSLLSPGNASEESITDIWLSEKFQRLREIHGTGKRVSVTPCNRCPA